MTNNENRIQFKKQFAEKGFFTVEGVISEKMLHWLNSSIAAVINEASTQTATPTGIAVLQGGGRYVASGISDTQKNLGIASLVLMGNPVVEEIASAVCGDNFVCTHDWMVIKNIGIDQKIGWHQDFVHDGTFPVINIGIHIDDAIEDAVCFYPGKRAGAEDICAIEKIINYQSSELAKATVKAGGISVHDVLLVHGSPPLQHQQQRKTIYFEIRPEEMLKDHPTINSDFICLRKQLFRKAKDAYSKIASDTLPVDLALDKETDDLIQQLATFNNVIEPANYCS